METEYIVVVNHEEQYSIWPTFRPVPNGWSEAGIRGSKEQCLSHIEKVWTDITPKSVREALATARQTNTAGQTRGD